MLKTPLLPVEKDTISRFSWKTLIDASRGEAFESVTTPFTSAETRVDPEINNRKMARQITVLNIHLYEAM